jgi:uncharacterized protein (TIGR02271 family)
MATTERPIVIGVFGERALADQAIDELRHAGFRDDEIRLAGHARAGGLLEQLASTLSGQAAADGNLPDELVRKGIPEEEAHYYQQELEAGRAIVVVESYGHQQEARDILHRYGAYDASARPTQAQGDRIIPVLQEELRVHKQLVATGEIVIRKEVITEEKTITVPLTREEVVIERRPGTAQPSDQVVNAGDTLEEALKDGGTLRIVLREEQVRIEKYPVVKEEIFISKRQIQEIRHVSDTLKREEAHIERVGNVPLHSGEVDAGAGEPEPEA